MQLVLLERMFLSSRMMNMNYTIPRTIHYCWFGGNPLGEREVACIESWKKFLPGYEIVQWNESNFDVRCCEYVSEAYDAKKWAFVSDYARFKILFDNGGLYFDTDVELIRPIDDLIAQGPFMGVETGCSEELNCVDDKFASLSVAGSGLTVNPGLGLSATSGLELYRLVLDSYNGNHFIKSDGSFDKTTIVTRVTGLLVGLGLKNISGVQTVAGVNIYPSDYFNPKDYFTGIITLTENTRSIHHFDASWYSREEKFEYRIATSLRAKGASDALAKKAAALLRIFRFCDVSRVKVAIKNRLQ